jgi:hypothetical protein
LHLLTHLGTSRRVGARTTVALLRAQGIHLRAKRASPFRRSPRNRREPSDLRVREAELPRVSEEELGGVFERAAAAHHARARHSTWSDPGAGLLSAKGHCTGAADERGAKHQPFHVVLDLHSRAPDESPGSKTCISRTIDIVR